MATNRKDKDSTDGEGSANRYDDELLSANWNPALDLIDFSPERRPAAAGAQSAEPREEDIDAFLARIYTHGC